MSTRVSAATTRALSGRAPVREPVGLLQLEETIVSPETRVQYRIERLLGSGGEPSAP